jgi:hypothetical protein
MNRRDALKTAMAGVSGVPLAELDFVDVQKPFVAVIRTQRKLGRDQRACLYNAWGMLAEKAGWPDLPLVIMDCGDEFSIIEDPRNAS